MARLETSPGHTDRDDNTSPLGKCGPRCAFENSKDKLTAKRGMNFSLVAMCLTRHHLFQGCRTNLHLRRKMLQSRLKHLSRRRRVPKDITCQEDPRPKFICVNYPTPVLLGPLIWGIMGFKLGVYAKSSKMLGNSLLNRSKKSHGPVKCGVLLSTSVFSQGLIVRSKT